MSYQHYQRLQYQLIDAGYLLADGKPNDKAKYGDYITPRMAADYIEQLQNEIKTLKINSRPKHED